MTDARSAHDGVAEDDEADRFLMRKLVAHPGWIIARGWLRSATPWLEKKVDPPAARRWLDAWLAAGELVPVKVGGQASRVC